MAKSFYGYVKRDDKAFVDWGAIGTQLSDDLALESKRRADKRQEIELQTIEDVKNINKLGADQSQLNSEFYMDAADQIREFLLMSQGEMQKGGWSGLRPSEFLKQRQVINDGVDQLATAAESQAAQQAQLLKRVQANEAGLTERYNHEDLDQFISTENKSVYINPINGRMSIATRDPITKKISTDPMKLLDINRLSTRMTYRANTPDIDSMVSKANKVLSPTTIALTQGGIKSIKTAMNNPKYLDAETSMIKGMMASDEVIANILGLDPEYNMTQDAAEANKSGNKKILTKKDENGVFVPILSESQKTEAEEILRARIRASLEKVQTGREDSSADRQYSRGVAKSKQKGVGYISELSDIFSGNAEKAESGLASIIGRIQEKEGYKGVTGALSDTGITLTFKDGSTDFIKKPAIFKDFVTGGATRLMPDGVDDVNVAYKNWIDAGNIVGVRTDMTTDRLGIIPPTKVLSELVIKEGEKELTVKNYLKENNYNSKKDAVEKVILELLPPELKANLKVSDNYSPGLVRRARRCLNISLGNIIENINIPFDNTDESRNEILNVIDLIQKSAGEGKTLTIEDIKSILGEESKSIFDSLNKIDSKSDDNNFG